MPALDSQAVDEDACKGEVFYASASLGVQKSFSVVCFQIDTVATGTIWTRQVRGPVKQLDLRTE